MEPDVMAKVIDKLVVEIEPTVTEDSAAACCVLLNLFAAQSDEYELHLSDGEVHLRRVRDDS